MIVLSLVGFLASAIAFVWAILVLIWRHDRGPLVIPATLIILPFLMFLLLAILEMRTYSWLKETRHKFEVAEKLAMFRKR